MTARYKLTKFRDKWNDGYFRPKYPCPNTVERQLGLKELELELIDQHVNRAEIIRDEAIFEHDTRAGLLCYAKERADHGYKCNCFTQLDPSDQ